MRKTIILFILILILPSALALDYNVQVSSPIQVDKYEGEIIENLFSATITNNAGMCDITCDWLTSMNTVGTGIKVIHDGGVKPFYFETKTQGNGGIATYTLTINCDRISTSGAICLSSPEPWYSTTYSFTFLYNGDGICTTSDEDCYSASNDCICETDKKCKEDLTRTQDEMGCTTYCGNNKVESQYETCSNCPSDVGKCNGMTCLHGNECEGKYCIHGICWNKPYKENDGYCDLKKGENCKNSETDCTCGIFERCSSGICETYCGNDQCEESEYGTCRADCKWCGDGECSNNENCGSCETDCGICESESITSEIQNKTSEAIKKSLSKVEQKQKIISYSAIGLILLIIIGYVAFKFVLTKKQQSKIIKEVNKKITKPIKKELNVKKKKSSKQSRKKK